uniref:Uncharacterized protein n=1 Tax=Marseillevirus LCMAC101 TaxID=2506602 RepID=A0A481YSH8_9VIRU|nr:MAG: hypothetical protein LCMAC101_05250 [Marseillevirus LCMAC101]
MDSKFRKADSYEEFYIHFRQYIDVLDKASIDTLIYDTLIKDWAEYSAVNKRYILGGPRGLKDLICNQMMNLLKKDFQILSYFLDIFSEEKEQDFSQLKRHFAIKTLNENPEYSATIENEETDDDLPDLEPDDEKVESEETKKEGNLEHVVIETLIGGAKLIGNLVGMVDRDIKNISTEIISISKTRMVKVKVIGPKKLDFVVDILDFFPSEKAGVIETELNDYDVGIYAFDHENWGNLEDVKDNLPTGKYRIACNMGPSQGDILMMPLFFDVWEFEECTKQDILNRLTVFA